jgi:transcriptional regulator with XRE-family HTH domain
MGARTGSAVRRRMLARRLRVLRERAGMTMDAAAPRLYWSVSKLSRIETAQQPVDVHGLKSMLDLYGVGGDEWTELTELAIATRHPGWWRAYGIGDNSYIGFEAEAVRVQEFTIGFVPGLLQVAPYSEALFLASPVVRSDAAVEREVAVRMRRRRRLTAAEDDLELVAVVAEAVLHNPVGGPAVLREQLDHLLMAAELDNVTLQVLPTAVGAHPALASGFTVLHFGDLGEPDIAYVEHALGAVQLEKEEDVALARLKFDQLRSLALDPAASQALIERAAGQI